MQNDSPQNQNIILRVDKSKGLLFVEVIQIKESSPSVSLCHLAHEAIKSFKESGRSTSLVLHHLTELCNKHSEEEVLSHISLVTIEYNSSKERLIMIGEGKDILFGLSYIFLCSADGDKALLNSLLMSLRNVLPMNWT